MTRIYTYVMKLNSTFIYGSQHSIFLPYFKFLLIFLETIYCQTVQLSRNFHVKYIWTMTIYHVSTETR